MGKSLSGRLDDLERRAKPPGRYIVGFRNDWQDPPRTSEAEARAECGPDDMLIVVEYVEQWRGAEPEPAA